MSEVTLDGANVTLAAESELEIVPPVVGEITPGGGERPLDVLAFGSGGVEVTPVAGVVVPDEEFCVAGVPTMTLIVPVPVPEDVVEGELFDAGS